MRELRTIIDKKEAKRRTNIRTNEHNKEKFKKQRRDENGLTKREKDKLKKIKAVKELKKKGYSHRKIADEIGINVRTVMRYIKEKM